MISSSEHISFSALEYWSSTCLSDHLSLAQYDEELECAALSGADHTVTIEGGSSLCSKIYNTDFQHNSVMRLMDLVILASTSYPGIAGGVTSLSYPYGDVIIA